MINKKEKDVIDFNKTNLYIEKSPKNYGLSYFAKKEFNKGDLVFKCYGKTIDHQTNNFSIQIDDKKYIMPSKWTGKNLNHSCDPNCYIVSSKDKYPNLYAKDKIKKREEINYAYYMTELRWFSNAVENDIKCKCGSKNCNGKIISFTQLQNKIKLNNMNFISKYLQKFIKINS